MAEDTHETKIVIKGDATVAVNCFAKVNSAIGKASQTVGNFIRTFSRINWLVESVRVVIGLFKQVSDWLSRDAEGMRKVNAEIGKIKSGIDAQTSAYERLNKQLAETLKLEKERNALADKRTARKRDIEDARVEASKQLEIAMLDPEAADYDQRKRDIERRYERYTSDKTEKRAREDNATQIERNKAEQESVGKALRKLEKELDLAFENFTRAQKRSDWQHSSKGYAEGDEKAVAAADEARELADNAAKVHSDLSAKWHQLSQRYNQLMQEGMYLNEGRGATAARLRNEANQQRITNDENAEKAREKREEDAKAAAKRQAEADRQAKAQAAAEMREKERRANDLASFAGRVDAFDGVSANRLTAMGLGSGVSAKGDVAGDVKRIADLLKQEVETSKKIAEKDNGAPGGAILGE